MCQYSAFLALRVRTCLRHVFTCNSEGREFQVPGDVGFFTSGGMTATDYDDIELQKLIDFK